MNSANLRAPRAAKPQTSTDPADLVARDLGRRLAATDDPLLRRWERIAREIRA